jgi:hypothetical protein
MLASLPLDALVHDLVQPTRPPGVLLVDTRREGEPLARLSLDLDLPNDKERPFTESREPHYDALE